jgi:hypothetical protein
VQKVRVLLNGYTSRIVTCRTFISSPPSLCAKLRMQKNSRESAQFALRRAGGKLLSSIQGGCIKDNSSRSLITTLPDRIFSTESRLLLEQRWNHLPTISIACVFTNSCEKQATDLTVRCQGVHRHIVFRTKECAIPSHIVCYGVAIVFIMCTPTNGQA